MRTEESYTDWVKRFVRFHRLRHPREMGAPEVESFLTHLAAVGKVSASTQNQALSARLFLYRQVLLVELPWLNGVVRAKVRPAIQYDLGNSSTFSAMKDMMSCSVTGAMRIIITSRSRRAWLKSIPCAP